MLQQSEIVKEALKPGHIVVAFRIVEKQPYDND